jgi:hypothetical protein
MPGRLRRALRSARAVPRAVRRGWGWTRGSGYEDIDSSGGPRMGADERVTRAGIIGSAGMLPPV